MIIWHLLDSLTAMRDREFSGSSLIEIPPSSPSDPYQQCFDTISQRIEELGRTSFSTVEYTPDYEV